MLINESFASQLIQPRPSHGHKGTFGRVLLIGGIYPYGGAIILSALAAVRSGAGLVTVATDRENIPALHSQLPEAMAFDVREIERLREQLKVSQVVLIGPGLGETSLAKEIVDMVLEEVNSHQVLVIDGSALTILAQKEVVHWQTNRLILTPHQKEWERLSGIAISEQTQATTQASLARFPAATILVAKSSATTIYQEQHIGQLAVGGPHQATGGTGDTLAGMIAGFVAQFSSDLFASVATATYLHSAIADDLAREAYVTLPSRISLEIPKWMKKLSEQ